MQSSFDDEGNVTDTPYDEWAVKFFDEYEWYATALQDARAKERCATETPRATGDVPRRRRIAASLQPNAAYSSTIISKPP